ncbi:hypothetical protein LTR85_010742 [Meristemomyces frigidus]|nr:hypothetical protein LTR85_010742 [Meristemomyces frigidus]
MDVLAVLLVTVASTDDELLNTDEVDDVVKVDNVEDIELVVIVALMIVAKVVGVVNGDVVTATELVVSVVLDNEISEVAMVLVLIAAAELSTLAESISRRVRDIW